jgi:nucleotide-binding universal stress UspA family protein
VNKIVLAVDGSKHSLKAAETAGVLSAALDATVDVINVVSDRALVKPGPLQDYERVERVTLSRQQLLEATGSDVVTEAVDHVRGSGGAVATTSVLVGSPAHEIVDYAKRVDADCIVMGRRGLGDVTGLLMGSVSHKVGHLSPTTLITTE